MLDSSLRPRVRAALRLETRADDAAVTMADTDLQFRGVPKALLADIIGRFNGRCTLDSICKHYPKPVTRVVQTVVTEMRARGMVLLSRELCEDWPDENALPRGAATWRYVRDRLEDPLAAWRRWRESLVVVYGSGVSFVAALTGLLDAGVGRLWIGPATAADRDAVATDLAQHAGREEAFEWRWVDAGDGVDPTALMLHVGDHGLAGWPDQVRSHSGRRVIAAAHDRGGTVWRLAAGDACPPLADPAAEGAVLSHYALSVLGNMAAFQSLNAILADDSTGEGTLLPLGATVRIYPDGRFATVATGTSKPIVEGGTLVRAESTGSVSPQQRERERWTRLLRPFTAGTSPLLAWEDETPLPVFPLPHRAMTLFSINGEHLARTAMWAVSPSDVTAHTLRHSIERLADLVEGVGGHAAATDEAEWRTRAYVAWAHAQAPMRLAQWPAWRLDYDDTNDVEFRTLVRLVALYLGEKPRIGIGLDPRSGLPRAEVAAGDYARFALATTPLAATIRALGALLSAHQLRERPLADAECAAAATAVCHLGLMETASVNPQRLGLMPHMLDTLNGVPLQGLLIGRFKMDGSDV